MGRGLPWSILQNNADTARFFVHCAADGTIYYLIHGKKTTNLFSSE